MTKLKAVMFDMDGVLIDSERLSLSMWEKVNEARGHVFDVSVMTNMMGGSQQENFERFGHLLPPMEVYEAMWQEKKQMTDAWIEANGMPLRPGVKEILAALKENGIRRLIVSSTPREYALYLLEKAGLTGCYDNGISAMKPAGASRIRICITR